MGETTIESRSIAAGQTSNFSDVNVNGDVFFTFDYVNEQDKAEAEAKAAVAADINNDVLGKIGTGNPSVTVLNETGLAGVQLDVRYLDDDDNVHNITSGREYPKGLTVFSRVVNPSNNRLRLVALVDGREVDSVFIEPKPANDVATYFGLNPIKLTGNLTFRLETVSGGSGTNNNSNNNGNNQNGNNNGNNNNGNIEKTYTITVNNGAAKANTDYAVNGLHVYDQSDPNLTDYKTGDKITAGKKISLYVYNKASKVHLKVTNNGKVVADKNYNVIESDNDVDWIEFYAEGDVVVTTSVGTHTPDPNPTPTPDPTPQEVKHKVTIQDNVKDSGAKLTVGYIDDDNKPVVINSGQSFKEGTLVSGRVANTSNKKLKLTVKSGDKVLTTIKIGSKPSNDDAAFGGYGPIALDKDQTWILEEDKDTPVPTPTPKTYTLTNADETHIYSVEVDGKEVKNGGKVEEGTRKITVTQADEPGTITLKVGDKVIGSHEFTGVYDSFDFTDVNVNADITVTFEKKPEEVTHKVNIEDKVNDQNAKLTVGYVDENNKPVTITSGQSFKEGTLVSGRIANASNKKLKLTIKSGDTVLETLKVGPKPDNDDAAFNGYGPIALDKDQTWILEEDVEDTQPKTKARVTINDGAKAANTASAVNGFHVYLPKDKDLREVESGEELPLGTEISIYPYNTASKIHLKIVHNGVTIKDQDYDVFEPYVTSEDFTDLKLEGDLVITTSVIN